MARFSLGLGRRRRQATAVPDKWLPPVACVTGTEFGLQAQLVKARLTRAFSFTALVGSAGILSGSARPALKKSWELLRQLAQVGEEEIRPGFAGGLSD